MSSMNLRRRVAFALAILGVLLLLAPTSVLAIKWGKSSRARVILPQTEEREPSAVTAREDLVNVEKRAQSKNKQSETSQRETPAPRPVAEPTAQKKKSATPVAPKKTELQKMQEACQECQKNYERKKYKKALEESCRIVSEIRERELDKKGSDGKGKDAEQYKELLAQALTLAEKSGGRLDEPIVPAGETGKTLYFVF